MIPEHNCGSRLPCGLCLITNSPCPFALQAYTPTWETTCQTEPDTEAKCECDSCSIEATGTCRYGEAEG